MRPGSGLYSLALAIVLQYEDNDSAMLVRDESWRPSSSNWGQHWFEM